MTADYVPLILTGVLLVGAGAHAAWTRWRRR